MSGFSPVGSSQVSVVTEPNTGADTPVIANISILPAIEASYTFPGGTRQYQIKFRGNEAVQLAFIAATSTITYLTIPRGCFYGESGLSVSGLTVYFQAASAGVVEILSWS